MELDFPEAYFIRGSQTRSSRSNGGGDETRQAERNTDVRDIGLVEEARERARAAADYYHATIIGSNSPPESANRSPYTYVNGEAAGGGVTEEDALRAGVTQVSSDAYYRAKLRAGFIDLRNSYNEKNLPRSSYPRSSHTIHSDPLERQGDGVSLDHRAVRKPLHKSLTDPHALYRSSSSLEIDQAEHADVRFSIRPEHLGRDFGSTSSLNVAGHQKGSRSAKTFDQYPHANLDVDRHVYEIPGPASKELQFSAISQSSIPQVRELMNSHTDMAGDSALDRPVAAFIPPYQSSPEKIVPNGSAMQKSMHLDEQGNEGPHSPKLKSKSQKQKDRKKDRTKSNVDTSSSIFKKLRGGKSDTVEASSSSKELSVDGEVKLDERLKRKAIVHYDCQSVGVSLSDVIKRKNSLNRRKNLTTGASAASGQRSPQEEDSGEMCGADPGDGKTNDLVLSCPFFRNEVGGEEEECIALNRDTAKKWVQQLFDQSRTLPDRSFLMRRPACNGVAILDTSPDPQGTIEQPIKSHKGFILEHVDHGASYYRNFFQGFDHQNLFGIHDDIGPVAISIKREKVEKHNCIGPRSEENTALYQYRFICRTSELQTLRAIILEDTIPSSSRLSNSRGRNVKDILEFMVPEIQPSCLKFGLPGSKTSEQLARLDEQGITKTYKIGIMYCKNGQSSEEEMYNNEVAGPAFEEFLNCIGEKVRLKNFEKYRGGLDAKTDSSGSHSLYTSFHDLEVMFHVSTMLPHTPNNKQQLLRKRHIGNDIVTIVFQEPGALPFTPKFVRSHFQHVFIIVHAHQPNTPQVKYSIAVSRSKEVPAFGPPIPDSAMFRKSPEFAEFLLTKAINAENAAHRSEKFVAMATRTRMEYLKDLASNFVSTTALDSGSKLSKFGLGSGRRKDKAKLRCIPDLQAKGAVVWPLEVENFGQTGFSSPPSVNCFLAVAQETFVFIEEQSLSVIYTKPCKSLIGWTVRQTGLQLYLDHGECIKFSTSCDDDTQEIVSRLRIVSQGCETKELTLRRNSLGQLGFHLHYDGIVAYCERHGYAWQAGLRQGSRLVEICNEATATLTHDQMINLLRTSITIKVVLIPPFEDGLPRRGCEESSSNHLPAGIVSREAVMLAEDDTLSISASHRSGLSTHSQGARFPNHMVSSQHNQIAPYSSSENHEPSILSKQESVESSRLSEGHYLSEVQSLTGQGRMPSEVDSFSKSLPIFNDDGARDKRASLKMHHNLHRNSLHLEDDHQDSQQSSRFNQSEMANHLLLPDQRIPYQLNDHKSSTVSNKPLGGSLVSLGNHYPSPGTVYAKQELKLSYSYGGEHGSYAGERVSATPSTSMSNVSQSSSHYTPSSSSSSLQQLHHQHQQFNWDHDKDHRGVRDFGENSGDADSGRASQSPSAKHSRKTARASNNSPHGSPITRLRRRDQVHSSAENLSKHGRQRAQSVKKSGASASSTFQEELMKLIDPDVSLQELEIDLNNKFLKGDDHQPLQRAVSDESVITSRRQAGKRYSREIFHMDDLNLAANQRSSAENGEKRGKGDLIATTAYPARILRRGQDSAAKRSSLEQSQLLDEKSEGKEDISLPLPDASSGIDWNHLLDAATKALQVGDIPAGLLKTPLSQISERTAESSSSSHSNLAMGIRNSKTTDKHKHHPIITMTPPSSSNHSSSNSHTHAHGSNLGVSSKQARVAQVSSAPAQSSPPPTPPERGSSREKTARNWKDANLSEGGMASSNGSNVSPCIQDLESHVSQLQLQLEQERNERLELEREVQQLQLDNARLQEESQTAAAQLRKFTEWFFNTIDRQ